MTPPPVQIRTNYLLAYDLLETAAWFSQLSAHADVHLDRIQRAVAHLRGQHVQSPPGQETPNTIHESPRRDMAWLLRNDPWAAAIAAHVRFYDQAALADEILRLRAENERLTKLQAPKLTCATCRREQPYHSMYRCFQCEAWFDHGHMASHLAQTHNVGESRELAALRSELAAATRERETPPDSIDGPASNAERRCVHGTLYSKDCTSCELGLPAPRSPQR